MGNLDLLFHQPILNLQLLVDGILVGALYFAFVAYGMAFVAAQKSQAVQPSK
jgi:hypothetical protein